jgi:hypothetical protein
MARPRPDPGAASSARAPRLSTRSRFAGSSPGPSSSTLIRMFCTRLASGSRPDYFFKREVQLRTTVTALEDVSDEDSTGRGMRNRWPSGETAKVW